MRVLFATASVIALLAASVLAALGAWLVYVDDTYLEDGPSLRAVGMVFLTIAALLGVPSFLQLRTLWQQRRS
jgi:hypothetical protein